MSREKPRRRPPAPATPRPDAAKPAWAAVLDRYGMAIAIALVAIATLRIAATYSVFSHTNDEPAHIACGMEWLDRGVYRYEAQHPPLARIASALGPYLLGRRYAGTTGKDAMFVEGLNILYQGNAYDETLTAARIGMLPFFWLACAVVFLWARRDFGPRTAVVALFLFTFLPPVLAHAGLATTDMAVTAFLGASFLAGRIWLERPSLATAAVFGVCGAGAVLSKFSSLAFFPAAAAIALAWYLASSRVQLAKAGRERLPSFAVAVAVMAVVVWAGYRFSFGKVDFANLSLPAPEFYRGIQEVLRHNAQGHLSYLFGSVSQSGWWEYYFVVLAVKTPIPFLLLAIAAVVLFARSSKRDLAEILPVAFSAGILAVALFSRINIGVRHILPIYIGLSILAAAALPRLAALATGRKWGIYALAAGFAWFALGSLLSHPDYLPYFNESAGSRPEKILVDSDLDWGQDMKRLERRLQQANAKALAIGSNYWVNIHDPNLPYTRELNPRTPVIGWNAVGVTAWKVNRFNVPGPNRDVQVWPDQVAPQEIVGKSIYLWYFPPSSGLPLQ